MKTDVSIGQMGYASLVGWFIGGDQAVCNDGCGPAWPKESPDRISLKQPLFSHHECSTKFLWSITEIYFQASRSHRECGGEVLQWFARGASWRGRQWRRRRRGFKRLLYFSNISKHLVRSLITSFDWLILNLRISLRNLWRGLHKPLLQGCRKPVWADWGGEQVWPAKHEGQPAQGAEEGPDEVGEGGQGLLRDAQEEQASASEAWPCTWGYHSPGNLDQLCYIARTCVKHVRMCRYVDVSTNRCNAIGHILVHCRLQVKLQKS